jgi:hypothetical protein
MNTYTHFLWAVVLSRWILLRKQKVDEEEEQDRSTSADSSNSNSNSNSNSDNDNDNGNDSKRRKTKAAPEFDRKGALLGSVLPDLPLIATTLVCIVLDYFGEEQEEDGDSWTGTLFDVWYFSNPWVVAEHNIFHSPVSLSFLILITYLWYNRKGKKQNNNNTMEQTYESPPASDDVVTELQQQQQRKPCCCYSCCGPSSFSSGVCSSRFWFWVFVSAMFHALCDIPVHHDDGPLLFWPLNRSYRFVSPVSYWDPNYYGIPFSIGEHLLDLIIVFDILIRFYRRRRNKQQWCFRLCPKKEKQHDEMEVMMVVAATSRNKSRQKNSDDDDDDDANDGGGTKRQHI